MFSPISQASWTLQWTSPTSSSGRSLPSFPRWPMETIIDSYHTSHPNRYFTLIPFWRINFPVWFPSVSVRRAHFIPVGERPPLLQAEQGSPWPAVPLWQVHNNSIIIAVPNNSIMIAVPIWQVHNNGIIDAFSTADIFNGYISGLLVAIKWSPKCSPSSGLVVPQTVTDCHWLA